MFLFLLFVWIVINGKLTLEIFLFGIVAAAALLAFSVKFLDYKLINEILILVGLPFAVAYLVVLVCEVIKASVAVMKLILNPNVEVEPAVVHFRVDFKTDIAKVLLANSITLTPGTITVSLKDNNYSVHALDKDLAEGIESCIFVRMLLKFEKAADKIIGKKGKA